MKIIMCSLFIYIFLMCGSMNVTGAEPGQGSGTKQKTILVTGASTGIGRKITEVLAARGYFVYAGARKQKDLDELNNIENVQSIRLDVTVQEDIEAAVETVRNAGRGLYGVVNNAGVAILGPIIEVDVEELEWVFDVNVFGVYRVTQAFAPLIIKERGRIIMMGSISGFLSGPFLGHYSMSKHAIEAYTDTLALEMERFGVRVSVIEPGNYKSQIALSASSRMQSEGYLSGNSPYVEDMKQRMSGPLDRSQYKEPDEVADAVLHALFDDDPKHRYMVVPNEFEAGLTIRTVLRQLVQLNERQGYTYNREQLINMLDELIGAR